jgi:predicted regulator of Ras-like GTPase activity (Roadblock/LC7/MglB family)
MPDEISRLSADVARNPGGRSSIALAEALRRARRLPAALDAAQRALERHPYDAEAHDILARIAADSGDDARARDEWGMSIRLDPAYLGALLGLTFLAFRNADAAEAQRVLLLASAIAPEDSRVARAAALVASMSPDLEQEEKSVVAAVVAPIQALTARSLFASIKDDGAAGVLLVDRDGHVVAGDARDSNGDDVAADLGAELCGLSVESGRALEQLGLGEWDHLSVECDGILLSIAPCADETLVLVQSENSTPMGMSRVLLARARRRATSWLEAL